MFKQILLISLIASLSFATTFEALTPMWESWKSQHNKAYENAQEEAIKFSVFADNVAKIEKLNKMHEHATFALNKFADLTGPEFKDTYAGCGLYEKNPQHEEYIKYDTSIKVPDSIDWREKGAVTPIKDQGQCGSCWSFSTTGVIESFHFIQSGSLVSLSEQQFLDCNIFTDHGCNGGLPSNAITYAAKFGLETEDQYPYKAAQGICRYKKSQAVKYVNGYKSVTSDNLDQFKAAVAANPVSVGIEADQDVFQFYKTGVITQGCGAQLDHAVLVVGYTKVNNVEGFIVKNSWGENWGDNGYVMIGTDPKANNGDGVCGILKDGVVPSL